MSSKIEWLRDANGRQGDSWNPTEGCSPKSPGCLHCYAAAQASRGMCESHKGLTRKTKRRNAAGRLVSLPVFNGVLRTLPERLDLPLRWREPRRVFVNSMSDLFHEGIPFEYIAAVWGVMQAARQHTFLVLTKWPERAALFFRWLREQPTHLHSRPDPWPALIVASHAARELGRTIAPIIDDTPWPPPNVHLGASMEDQPRWNERIEHLRRCEAVVLWGSLEPLLGPINMTRYVRPEDIEGPRSPWAGRYPPQDLEDGAAWPAWVPEGVRSWIAAFWRSHGGAAGYERATAATYNVAAPFGHRATWATSDMRRFTGRNVHMWNNIRCIVEDGGRVHFGIGPCAAVEDAGGLDWIVAGGESGQAARPCDVEWIRGLIAQARAAETPIFVKQAGDHWLAREPDDGQQWRPCACSMIDARDRPCPVCGVRRVRLARAKGGDPEEWPEDIRVREFPA